MKLVTLTMMIVSACSSAITVGPLYIYEGDYYYGSLTLPNPSPVYMYGGHVSGIIMPTGTEIDPECYIYGGSVDGIACAGGYLEITGGEITSPIEYYTEGSMTLAGGLISSVEIDTWDWSSLNQIGIVCLDYSITDVKTVAMGDATGIKNFWLNVTFDGMAEQSIFIKYTYPVIDYYGPEKFLNITIIPEPATLALLGLGGLVMRRNSSRNGGLKR